MAKKKNKGVYSRTCKMHTLDDISTGTDLRNVHAAAIRRWCPTCGAVEGADGLWILPHGSSMSVWARLKRASTIGTGITFSPADVALMFSHASIEDEVEEQLALEPGKTAPVTYVSERNFPLAYTGIPVEHPILTCELYPKWYHLYLVDPGGLVRPAPLDLDELEQYAEGTTTMGDHCWNPYVLQRLADAKDWLIDDVSFDLIVGRWHTNMGTV